MVGVEIEAEIRRRVAIILMKHNDYDGARNKLLDAQKAYPGLEHIDELVKVSEMACAVESGLEEGGIDWYSVLQINMTANESDIEVMYKELIRSLEPVKNKFPEIQSALGLIEEAYSAFSGGDKSGEFDCRRDGSLRLCGSAKLLDIAHSEEMNMNIKATSQSSSGTKRIVSEGSDKSNLLCNSLEQPLKTVRSLGGEPLAIEHSETVNTNLETTSQSLSGIKKIDSEGCRRDGSLRPCGSAKQLDTAHSEAMNIDSKATSQSLSGTKRIVSEGSDKSNLMCNSPEQPLKRITSLSGDDSEVIAEAQSLSQPVGEVCSQEASSHTATSKTGLRSRKIAVGQFLAFYDQEKLPRSYAQINRMETCYKKETNSTEYTLYVWWLKPAPINPDERKWHEAGLPVSCGGFKLDSDKTDKFNIEAGSRLFSHLVYPFQNYYSLKEFYQIYPREGEVWALYKEWQPFDWCSDPETRKGCKFHLVEILSDYSIEAGVKVVFVVKVAGYETIFRRGGFSFQVAAGNLFEFSHNIPVKFAGIKRGVFSGMVLELDRFSIPEDVVVDIVEAEFSNCSSVSQQNSGSPPITSELNPKIDAVNPYAGDVTLSSGNQNVKQLNTTSPRLVLPGICEEKKCQADATSNDENIASTNLKVGNLTVTNDKEKVAEEIVSESDDVCLGGCMADGMLKDENTSLNSFEMAGSSKEKVTAENDKEKVAEEIDSESGGVSFGGSMVNESECGNSLRDSDDAIKKLDDEENMADEIDGVNLGGSVVNESESENGSSDSDDTVNKLDISEVIESIKKNENKESKWQTEDDMLSSLEEDPVLSMKAVCALHRQQFTKGKSVTASLHKVNQRFSCFSKFVALRGNELAEFLTDNNPKGDLKKSVEELEMFMPEGLEDCTTLARFYSNELFTIYLNHEDPFFGPF